MKKSIYFLFLFILAKLATAQTAPYTISNNAGWIGGGDYAGSSFLTLGSGQIDSIDVISRSNTTNLNDTLYIYSGNTTDPASQIHKESIGPVSSTYNTSYRIRLTTPVQVNASTTYTFYIYGFPLRYGTSDTYVNGTYWDNNGEQTGSDLDFTLYIGTSTLSGVISGTSENNTSPFIYKTAERKIEVNSQILGDYELMLFDLQGNKLVSSKGQGLTVPSTLTEAVYIVKLQTKDQVYSSKVFIR